MPSTAGPLVPPPPASEDELLARARALAGRPLGELALRFGVPIPPDLKRAKGWAGQLLELALGATAGSKAHPDFERLGVEMKSLPVDRRGAPVESTFVTTIDLAESATLAPWLESRARRKLDRVLWVPIEGERQIPPGERRIGVAMLWSPTEAEDAALRADWEQIAELIDQGFIERLTARVGVCMQMRPKAANARALRWTMDEHGAPMRTLPRGLYLRPSFTAKLLQQRYIVG